MAAVLTKKELTGATYVATVSLLFSMLAFYAYAEEADPTDDAAEAALGDDLLKDGTVFKLVDVSTSEPIAPKMYWRRFNNFIAAQTSPVRFLVDGANLIAPRKVVDKQSKKFFTVYPTESRRNLSNGKHVLQPGDIPIDMNAGKMSSPHPALKFTGQDVHILCAPVRLESVDASGAPIPVALKLTCGKEPLLREAAHFSALIIWLPVGLKYTSTLGTFSIAADGKLSAAPADLAPHVKLLDSGLTLTAESLQPTVRVIENTRLIEHIPGENKKPILCYVEPLIAPGQHARIALSKKQYEAATKTPLLPAAFSYLITPGKLFNPYTLTPYAALAATPPPALEHAAAKELKTDSADLVWFNLPVPKSVSLGTLSYALSEKSFGTLRGFFVVADTSAALQLISHRLRSVYADTEEAPYMVLVKPGFAGGDAKILCQPDAPGAKTLDLGTLTLPATKDAFDSRTFSLRMRDIPAGAHQLWLESPAGSSQRTGVSVVSWLRKSPFLVQSMAACGGMWPEDSAGLKLLQEAGVEMVSNGGFGSTYKAELPGIDTHAFDWLARESKTFAPESAYQTTASDLLLQRLLEHQIRHIDFYPRGQNFYLEGLSYHHSFKPSVDRMVRRLQIFTQQTADYPSFWGMNYSWFPSLFGYAESGVDTDIHKRDRNAALEENLRKAGQVHLSADERKQYDADKFSPDAAKREKALQLMQRAVAFWKAQMHAGFGEHNKMYNDAVRQIRPDAQCVLFENAGHDENKRTRSLFNDMDAMTYESYSDYPEWPFSASFTTDWARGNNPGRPVWITVDTGSSSEGMMKSLFHAFGRGAAGAGTIMPAEEPASELSRRGKGLRFVSQYGAIPTRATPDRRFAILSTAAEQILNPDGRTQYFYHAMYYHLTRLGCAPVILDDEEAAASGIPEDTKLLFIVRQRQPFEPKVAGVIDAFMKKGGKIIVTGDSLVKLPGAIVIEKSLKHIWNFSGFQVKSHAEMWDEFTSVWRAPLEKALAQSGVASAASTDPDRGVVVALDAGAVRYAVVIADDKGQTFMSFRPTTALPVSLEGTGWQVRDLARQQPVPATEKDGRTLVNIDLVTEPATVLALYKTAPASIEIKTRGTPRLGGNLVFNADVSAVKGGPSMGALPLKLELLNPAGISRHTLYRAAGEDVRIPLPALDQPGAWKLLAQELLTGVTATLELTLSAAAVPPAAVPPAAVPPAATPSGGVHVVNEAHVREFFKHAGEKRVVIEAGQERLLPLAQKLVAALTASGIKTRLWRIKPEDFDTIPVRWYPTDDDVPRLASVEAGNLIGFRENLAPFIDAQKRAHVPEKGGYGEIDPLLMVGADCIVFSGGTLANGLRAVTPWMSTPTIPGIGQGRLVACFSPFLAGRHALAIVANDDAGLSKAADQIAAFAVPQKPPAAIVLEDFNPQTVTLETKSVPTPFVGYAPMRRIARLLATRDGKAVVCLEGKKDTRVFVDAAGKITGTVASADADIAHAQIDNDGRCWELASQHLGGEWYFQEITLRCIGTDGTLQKEIQAYKGSVFYTDLPTDWQGGFPVSPDGATAVLGLKGGVLLGKLGDPQFLRYNDIPSVSLRDAIRHPRFPVGAHFSSDGRCVLLTMDTRPPGWGGMNWPAEHPSASETILLDTATGKPLWKLRDDKNSRKTAYAVHTGFGAVANDGALSAFADYNGSIYLVDKAGKIILQEQVAAAAPARYSTGPLDGIGVWMQDEGKLVAFGFKNLLLITSGKTPVRVLVAQLVSGCVSGDATLAIAALESGEVKAFDASGALKWTVSPGGIAPQIAAVNQNQTLVATSLGDLVLLDSAGKELRRTNLIESADREKHALKPAAPFHKLARPRDYVEPGTLELAREELAARQIAAWKPAGQGTAAFGKTFYPVSAPITIAAPANSTDKDVFVHLVYRRLPENKALTVLAETKEGKESFILDLATPEYRVLDLPFGAATKITVSAEGPAEIAECSLWSYRWPGPNVAFVQPAKSGSLDAKDTGDIDSLLGEIDGDAGLSGKMKECKIWSPNPDVDKVAGPYLKPPVGALLMADGKRFGNGKILPWTKEAFMGCWFTVDFGKAIPIKVVATFDRAQKQSELSRNIAVFSVAGSAETMHGGAIDNDQFWRVFSLPSAKIQTLGVHVYSGNADGLSEIEAYSSIK